MAALPDESMRSAPTNQTSRYRRSKALRGTGLSFLREQILHEDTLDAPAKDLLRTFLSKHSINIDNNEEYPPPTQKRPKLPLKTINSSMSDESILQFARQDPSPMSLLASLLKILNDDGGAVTARALLKTCALTVRPAWVPAQMDAKEMVLAALEFLCATTNYIRPVQTTQVDLEKRSYEKLGKWSLDGAMLEEMSALEEAFYQGSADLTWLPRTHFVPRIHNAVEEDLLLLKGNPPAGSMAKKIVRRKKITAKKEQDRDDS